MLGVYNQTFAVSQTAVRCRRKAMAGGKSELRRAVRRVTPGQGDLKDSGTENIPPCERGVVPDPFFAGKGEKVR
jgi:hypothetical protein